MTLKTLSTNKSHYGTQGVYSHASSSTKTEMTFSVFMPDGEGPFPVLWYLSGLTCTHANVTEKGEYRAACAQHGIIFIAPDTSPRGDDVPNDDAYDMGQGAGFYVNASQAPWAKYFHMRDYIETELPALIAAEFAQADMSRQSITGHSMGGHGALTIGLRNPETFKSISAFSPIVAPMQCPWGEKALSGYLGTDKTDWAEYDACALIEGGARANSILIDQGLSDNFLEEQLKTHLFEQACNAAGQDATIRMQDGYDHSYYFISTFMHEHIAWHANHLK
ncbi:MAG: S-formylglutathione hydrolase [Hellea sp.]